MQVNKQRNYDLESRISELENQIISDPSSTVTLLMREMKLKHANNFIRKSTIESRAAILVLNSMYVIKTSLTHFLIRK